MNMWLKICTGICLTLMINFVPAGSADVDGDSLSGDCKLYSNGLGKVCVNLEGTATVQPAQQCSPPPSEGFVCARFGTTGSGSADLSQVFMEWADDHLDDECTSSVISLGIGWCGTDHKVAHRTHAEGTVCNTIDGLAEALNYGETIEDQLKVGPDCSLV